MEFKSKILIIDDDENIPDLVSSLIKEGYDTKILTSGTQAFSAFQSYNPNLVILDLILPGKNGYDICKEIRQLSNVPIIIITTKDDVFDKILAFELGADDYVVKPFDLRELMARVKAILKRYSLPSDTQKQVVYEYLDINLSNYSVVYKGKSIEMPPKELELLYFLASSPNQVFTREQLLNRIWGYEYLGDTRTVDVHVKRIREKLKDNEYWEIKTVWGVGYKFEVK